MTTMISEASIPLADEKCPVRGRGQPTGYDEAVDGDRWSRRQRPAAVSQLFLRCMASSAPSPTPSLRARVNACQIVGPDGQPVSWAMNFFNHAGLPDRVYGPEVLRPVWPAVRARRA